MSYLSNYDDLCIHLYGRKIPLRVMFLQRNKVRNTKKDIAIPLNTAINLKMNDFSVLSVFLVYKKENGGHFKKQADNHKKITSCIIGSALMCLTL